jgi:hypothetical protein
VARLLHGLPEAEDFALAGGAALIVHGDVDRRTRDLDFFTVEPDAVDGLLPAFEAAVREAGLALTVRQRAHGFARLIVSDDIEQTGVDLATDARMFPPESSDLGLTLSAQELAVDKVLALFGRAEARDFVDLAALEPRFGLAHLASSPNGRTEVSNARFWPRCSTGSIAWTETSSTSTIGGLPPSSWRCGGGGPISEQCRAEIALRSSATRAGSSAAAATRPSAHQAQKSQASER